VTLMSPVHEKLPAGTGERRPAGVSDPRFVSSVRHLVQRPVTREEFLLGSAVQGVYNFVLFDELPFVDPLFAGDQDRVDGLHFITATMEEVARFVGLRHLRIPRACCPPVVTRASVDITDVDPWRLGGRRGQAVVDLHFRALGAAGAPRGLECEVGVGIDGVPCATARAQLAFPQQAPAPVTGRPRLLAEDLGRMRPASVGRTDGRDVVVHGRLVIHENRVLMDVVPHPGNPVFDPDRSDRAGAVLLIEASRQAATLAAGELRGLSTAHCVLTRWSAEFGGEPDNSLPLRCSAVPGPLVRDRRDRPMVPVRIDFTQDERCVGTVNVAVLQDC
jgi:2-oxo-3-(phosphooxy)propyl 3-oxoalkanoate synthase